MKAIIVALTAAFVLVGFAPSVSAESQKHHRYVKKHYKKYAQYRPGPYWERNANKLPYGTGIWWEQMDREGRGGRR